MEILMEFLTTFSMLLIVIILGLLVLYLDRHFDLLQKIQKQLQGKEQKLPYKKQDFLLNIPERKFFEGLQQIIPNNYVIFPQIPLSSVVDVSTLKREFWTYQNKINRKIVDFVIFEKQYLKPIIVIEYDGKTHYREDRQIRDEFVDKVLESAEIKIIHIKHQQNINFEEIKNKINDILKN